MQAAVFLDRDGTINQEVGYIREVNKLNLIPGVSQVIRELNQMKIPVIVVTNQSGVARGYYDEEHLGLLHARMENLLKQDGASVDAIYYCPHLAEGIIEPFNRACDCRKPEPGMLIKAAETFDIDFEQSFMIGDKATDVDVGNRVNCQTILLRDGYGQQVLDGTYQHRPDPNHIMDNLIQAFQEVIKPFYQRIFEND